MKFLFRMENVGPDLWSKRKEIVTKYFETVINPFVKETNNGYSVADFQYMIDALEVRK